MPDTRQPVTADEYFAIIPEWLLDTTSPRAVQVYGFLRRYADKGEGLAWPSRATLAKRARCTRKTIDRALAELIRVGAITVTARLDDAGDQTSNLYQVHTSPVGGRDIDVATPRDINVAGGRDIDVAQNQSQFEPESDVSEEVDKSTTQITKRPRDLLWESFIAVHGEPASKTERGKYNKAVAVLREAEVEPDEYPGLVQAYVTKHAKGDDGLQPAPMTVATRIGELRHFRDRGPIRAVSERDRTRAHVMAEIKAREQ